MAPINKKYFFAYSRSWTQYGYQALFFLTLFVAVIIRFKYLFVETISSDDALYAWQAQQIYADPSKILSREMIQFHPPLFSVLLSLGFLVHPSEISIRIVSMILNVLGVVAIYALGRKISSRFVGLIAAIGLMFNVYYLEIGAHILIDDALVLFICLLMLCLMKEKNYFVRMNALMVGIAGSLIVLLKWSGILVVPYIAASYLIAFREHAMAHRVKRMLLPLALVLFIIGLLLANNYYRLGHALPDLSAFGGVISRKPFWAYAVNIDRILGLPFIVIPFLVGELIFIFVKRKKAHLILGLNFIIFFLGISILPEKLMRYGMMILPSGLLITGLGIEHFLRKVYKKEKKLALASWLCLLLMAGYFMRVFPAHEAMLNRFTSSQVGYREAGEFIKHFNLSDGIVMAGSRRRIRYYSGLDFKEFGGIIWEIPKHKIDFENIVAGQDEPILLVVDAWEILQPDWVYPFDAQKEDYLKGQGFKLVKTVKKAILLDGQNKTQRAVIRIFYRQ